MEPENDTVIIQKDESVTLKKPRAKSPPGTERDPLSTVFWEITKALDILGASDGPDMFHGAYDDLSTRQKLLLMLFFQCEPQDVTCCVRTLLWAHSFGGTAENEVTTKRLMGGAK